MAQLHMQQPMTVNPEFHGITAENRETYWHHHKLGLLAARSILHSETDTELSHFLIGQAIEISELHANNDRLVNLSNTDSLTGLSNRRGAELVYRGLSGAKHNQEKRQTPPKPIDAYALVVDLDDFKNINETNGHQAGDEVLKSIGEIMRNNTRPNDLVARWGGDEFIVLLPRTPRNRADDAANAIREEVHDITPITVSVGVGKIDFNLSLEETVSLADQALMQAKLQGKNVVVHFDEMNNPSAR